MGWPVEDLGDGVREVMPDDWTEQITERVRGGARLIPQLAAGVRRAGEAGG